MTRLLSAFFCCAVLCAAAGCAGTPANCAPGLNPMLRSDVFFGRNIGTVEGVNDTAWQNFLDQEITPRFPDGLTLVAGNGQWRGPDGRGVSERGFVLTLLGTGSADDTRKLDDIRRAYRTRFMQDAVLLVQTRVCAGF